MELKPCPFCGNEYVSVIPAVDKSAWWCKCEDCGVETKCFKAKLEAIDFWNQRKKTVGKWIFEIETDMFHCSKCNGMATRNDYPFCHWCGADMREVE